MSLSQSTAAVRLGLVRTIRIGVSRIRTFPRVRGGFTDTPGLGIGFRLIRPLDPPTDRAAQESFWKADIAKIKRDAKNRIQSNGRGSWGVVDADLPSDIAGLEE